MNFRLRQPPSRRAPALPVALLCGLGLLSLPAVAATIQTVSYAGAIGSWSNPALWTGGVVPGAGDVAVIPNVGRIIYDTAAPSPIGGINGNALTLTLQKDLTIANFNFREGILVDNGHDLTVTGNYSNSSAGGGDGNGSSTLSTRTGGNFYFNNVRLQRSNFIPFYPGDAVSGDLVTAVTSFNTWPDFTVTQSPTHYGDRLGAGLSLEGPSAAFTLGRTSATNQSEITLNWDAGLTGTIDWTLRWKGSHVAALTAYYTAGQIRIGTVPTGQTFSAAANIFYDATTDYTYVGFIGDSDGDGTPDGLDLCPGGDDRIDTDQDGTPDACDACPIDAFNDSDGDGACDSDDYCPFDADDDADNDGLCADDDICPFDGDNDFDNDGVCGDVDVCPLDAANDADGDGICGDSDACLAGDDGVDTDGDGTADACDICPFDAENDADSDGICGDEDPCPFDADNDGDGDGVCGDEDPCPLDFADDSDGDAICDSDDPCPDDQLNDADGDGLCESVDNCPTVDNPNQSNVDGDAYGDACEPDADGDGVADDSDNCPLDLNADQADSDGDGFGDACDADDDGDGVLDASDSCLATPPGSPVLVNGCSWDEECVCSAPWKNHGAYVSCVARATNKLVALGRITGAQKGVIQSAAGSSQCGK